MKEKLDLTGKQFGDWTVLYEEPQEGYVRKWRCRCVCGAEKTVYQGNLTQGKSQGCGCAARQQSRERSKTHGKRHTRIYTVWCLMRRRCYDKTTPSYNSYGGRGITVCDEWLGKDGFQNFWNWAYANGYDADAPKFQCTIDRIDVNGNYCPENCRWVDMRTQARNKQDTHWVEFGGETISLAEFCEKYNVSHGLACERLQRGWSPAEVMFFNPKEINGSIEYNGEVKTARGWAKRYGIPKSTFQYRITHGWTIEQAIGKAPRPNRYAPSCKEQE